MAHGAQSLKRWRCVSAYVCCAQPGPSAFLSSPLPLTSPHLFTKSTLPSPIGWCLFYLLIYLYFGLLV